MYSFILEIRCLNQYCHWYQLYSWLMNTLTKHSSHYQNICEDVEKTEVSVFLKNRLKQDDNYNKCMTTLVVIAKVHYVLK